MALFLEMGKDNLEVISSKDDAVTVDAEAYGKYLETLDEAILCLKPGVEPTRFVLRRMLSYGMTQKIKTEQAGLGEDGKVQIRMGYILDDVRASLVDIKNPGSPILAFKKDSDGYASKELVAMLEQAGIANELYAARQAAVKSGGASKKS